MADISLYTGIGRLTRDAEVKTIPSGKTIMQFTLASNPSWNREDPALFMDCQLWGDRGIKLAEFLKKGSKVCVHGTLKQESWVGVDGLKKTRTKVDLSYVSLLDSRKQEGEPRNYDDAPRGYRSAVEAQVAALFGAKDERLEGSISIPQKVAAAVPALDAFNDDIPF